MHLSITLFLFPFIAKLPHIVVCASLHIFSPPVLFWKPPLLKTTLLKTQPISSISHSWLLPLSWNTAFTGFRDLSQRMLFLNLLSWLLFVSPNSKQWNAPRGICTPSVSFFFFLHSLLRPSISLRLMTLNNIHMQMISKVVFFARLLWIPELYIYPTAFLTAKTDHVQNWHHDFHPHPHPSCDLFPVFSILVECNSIFLIAQARNLGVSMTPAFLWYFIFQMLQQILSALLSQCIQDLATSHHHHCYCSDPGCHYLIPRLSN